MLLETRNESVSPHFVLEEKEARFLPLLIIVARSLKATELDLNTEDQA